MRTVDSQRSFLKDDLSDALKGLFVGVHSQVDCTLEMRQPRWAHFAGKGLQSETETISAEVSADDGKAHGELRERR
jgi:hypothetical protein